LSSGSESGFIAKYSSTADLIWLNEFPSLHGINDIALNEQNGIYISGTVDDRADMDPSAANYYIEAGSGPLDAFDAVYKSDGTFEKAYTFTGSAFSGAITGKTILPLNNGSYLSAGTFTNVVDLDPTIGVEEYTTQGVSDIYMSFIRDDLRTGLCGSDYNLCFKWTSELSVFQPDDELIYNPQPRECKEIEVESIQSALNAEKLDALNAYKSLVENTYIDACAGVENLNDEFSISYDLGVHHFTLYYYDRAGNLKQTVPPAGVNFLDVSNKGNLEAAKGAVTNHNLETFYEYNSLGQLTRQETPDAGVTNFIYNDIGQLRFSQNAQQTEDKTYSYTKYDPLGRITEVGVAELGQVDAGGTMAEFDDLKGFYNDLQYPTEGTEITFTVYTTPSDISLPDGLVQRNLINRVSYSYLDEDGIDDPTVDDRTINVYS
ncbi:MAG: hypothetical protein AAFN93_27975, partial [Bacteroidota bacterium]